MVSQGVLRRTKLSPVMGQINHNYYRGIVQVVTDMMESIRFTCIIQRVQGVWKSTRTFSITFYYYVSSTWLVVCSGLPLDCDHYSHPKQQPGLAQNQHSRPEILIYKHVTEIFHPTMSN